MELGNGPLTNSVVQLYANTYKEFLEDGIHADFTKWGGEPSVILAKVRKDSTRKKKDKVYPVIDALAEDCDKVRSIPEHIGRVEAMREAYAEGYEIFNGNELKGEALEMRAFMDENGGPGPLNENYHAKRDTGEKCKELMMSLLAIARRMEDD